VEIIGITADEAERPRQTIPKAVRRVSKRIVIYYVGAIFVLGLNVSSDDPVLKSYVTNPEGSYQGPFVLMVQRANISGLDHILNAISIVATLSVANANLYVTVILPQIKANSKSRTLYALATEGHGPAIFKRMNSYGVPWVALVASSSPAGLAYMSIKVTENDVCPTLKRF
jgi:yeast amino acid transporter